MANLNWQHDVLPRAREIVESYDTGVTLRQLFYRLVADTVMPIPLPNTQSKYIYLSRITAEGRRDGTFPDLVVPSSACLVPGCSGRVAGVPH
jgi:hypothetical protein